MKGLFRGTAATAYREVFGYCGQFFTYEAVKRLLLKPGEREENLGVGRLLFAGGSAGSAGWLLSYPQDYIKSQIQAEPYNKKSAYRKHPFLFDGGFWDCGKQIVQQHGMFFKCVLFSCSFSHICFVSIRYHFLTYILPLVSHLVVVCRLEGAVERLRCVRCSRLAC